MLRIVFIILILFLLLAVIIPAALHLAGIDILLSGSGTKTSSGSDILLVSSDGGNQWQAPTFSPASPRAIFDVAFQSQNPSIIFAGGKASGLWKSMDSGTTWNQVHDSAGVLDPKADVHKIAISPARQSYLYLAVFQGGIGRVLKSTDAGGSFREVYFVTANRFGVFDIYADPADAESVFVVTGQGNLLHSADGGMNWKILKNFGEPLTTLVVNPSFPQELYVGTDRGRLYKTFDGGTNWTDLSDAVSRVEVTQTGYVQPPESPLEALRDSFSPVTLPIVIDPRSPATLYLGSSVGLLRSVTGAMTWDRVPTLLPSAYFPPRGIALRPTASATVFVSAGHELDRSDDAGISWRGQMLPTRLSVKKLFIHPANPDRMFAILGK